MESAAPPPVPPRRPRERPPLPARPLPRLEDPHAGDPDPQLPPRARRPLPGAPPLPTRPRPAIADPLHRIATPPPVAHTAPPPEGPRTPAPDPPAAMHASDPQPPPVPGPPDAPRKPAPHAIPPALTALDVVCAPTPPVTAPLLLSAAARQAHTRSSSGGSATPPPSVRNAAMRGASANPSRGMLGDNVLNFRDLGVSVINASLRMHHTRAAAESVGPMPGVVFRSAELGSVCERDVRTLLSKYRIRTIIDLRSEMEARANNILAKYYPATMQPTADESSEKLLRLRAEQLRNTIVEVAAHDYEAATRPWERTGESRSNWTHRSSLRYSRTIGDPRTDPVARALAHLYDPPSDSDTQTVTAAHPYVPQYPPAAVMPPADSSPPPPPPPPPPAQGPGLAQTAYDWGSETLQMLRSYLDYQWPGAAGDTTTTTRGSDPPSIPLPPIPAAAPAAPARPPSSAEDNASAASAPESVPASSPPHSQPGDPRPADHAAANDGDDDDDDDDDDNGDCDNERSSSTGSAWTHGSSVLRAASRAHTEPLTPTPREHSPAPQQSQWSLTALERGARGSVDGAVRRPGARRPRVTNRFGGRRSRYRCNIIGENYRKKCVWAHAPLSTKIKVVLRFATFNKAEGIRTIGRDVLAPRGLAGSYEDYIDYCKQEFASVMRIFADPGAYPILFHCHHGKDRTGIVAMLLLGILGVDDQIIAADYAQSAANLAPVRKRMELIDMGAVGLPPSFCDAPAPVMLSLLHHIRTNYGSVRGYLRSTGLTTQELDAIAWCLRGNFYGLVQLQPQPQPRGRAWALERPSPRHRPAADASPGADSEPQATDDHEAAGHERFY
ncbi:hypothetical protein H4R18_005531 [Coemansia javaensis]|uniref:Tyrosine specific protein phosphatases domain-containing protein n=1 Tax=Coemansia javaensis TaxID=2761396 RepID=A0A9W8LFE8_9FUNG|nr:hypothetical protein H4R18_005531 [Coemansia javaensis]